MFLFAFFCILVLLIIVHELGHFGAAKLFKIKVEEFGIFFPPRIAAWRRGETEYSINWLPFGGFVKIFGENFEEGADDPRSFARKNRGIQALVILAGILCNFLFAWLVLSAGYMVGLPTSVEHQGIGVVQNAHATIVDVLPGSPAEKAGLLPNDVVTDVQTGTASLFPNSDSAQVQQFIANHQNESVLFQVTRDGVQKEFLAKPAEGFVAGKKVVGVELDDVGILKVSPPIALWDGAILGWQMLAATAVGLGGFLWALINGIANFGSVAGPIGIAGIGAAAVKAGFATTITLTALISINLGLVNLVPVPGLDGGRLLFIIIEAIIRRPIPSRYALVLTLLGFALLIALMLVISYHDVLRIVEHKQA